MTQIACFTENTETVWGVAVTPDCKYIISGSGDKTVKV